MTDVNKPSKFIKIPNTAFLDSHGNMSTPWLYFFNTVGDAIDSQVAANLPELIEQVTDTVNQTLLLKKATEDNELATSIANESIAANIEAIRVANSNLARLDGRLTTMGEQVGKNATTLATHGSRIESQGKAITELQNAVGALDGLQQAVAELQALQAVVSGYDDTLRQLQERVTALEGRP